MQDQQIKDLARALAQECTARTLGALGDALTAAERDGAAGAGLRAAVETARDVRQEVEQQAAQDAAQRPADSLGDALARDRAAGRR